MTSLSKLFLVSDALVVCLEHVVYKIELLLQLGYAGPQLSVFVSAIRVQ